MSPDPMGSAVADPSDPQSWKMYAYARNNPLINIDPDGYDCVYLNNAGNAAEEVDQQSNSGECGDHGGYWVDGTFTSGTVYANSNDVYLRGYDSSTGQLTDSYTNVVTSTGPSPISTDVFSGPNLFAFNPLRPIPPASLNAMIHSLNRSGLSDKLVNCVIQHETRGESGLQNLGSSALGLLQMLRGTAGGVASANSGDFGGMSGGQVYSQMKDPSVAIVAGTDLMRANAGGSHDATRAMEREYGSKDPSVNAAFAQEMTACAAK